MSFLIIYFTTGDGDIPLSVQILQDIFMSFAAGTFIGVAFEEVIEVEMNHHEHKKAIAWKFLCLLAGFIFISLFGIYEWAVERNEDT